MADLRLMDYPELYPEVAAKAAVALGVPVSSRVLDTVREFAEAPGLPAPVQTAMERAIAAMDTLGRFQHTRESLASSDNREID